MVWSGLNLYTSTMLSEVQGFVNKPPLQMVLIIMMWPLWYTSMPIIYCKHRHEDASRGNKLIYHA